MGIVDGGGRSSVGEREGTSHRLIMRRAWLEERRGLVGRLVDSVTHRPLDG
jgi:hypothetical protein